MKSRYFKKIDDKNIQCQTCSHYCIISDGNFGICKTRKNTNRKLDYIYWGKIISQNIDPIEKKPLYHFMKNSLTYSVCTPGCNFKCPWCQNFEISQLSEKLVDGNIPTIKPIEIVNSAIRNGCPSISYTYTEPTLMGDWAIETMKLAHKSGLKNIWVSNGYMSKKLLADILLYLDAINIDLKFMDEKKYLKNCGAKLKPILENITTLFSYRSNTPPSVIPAKAGIYTNRKNLSWIPDQVGDDITKHKIHLELTTLIIPGLNDSKTELTKIAKFIFDLDPKIPWHISRFYPHFKLSDLNPTDIKTLEFAQKIAKNIGLKNVYVGNV